MSTGVRNSKLHRGSTKIEILSIRMDKDGWPTSDSKSAEQSYQFLKKWFDEHPQYLAVQLFVGGDSYSGITVPLVTKKIVDCNKDGVKPFMNLKNAKKGCNENYMNVDPANTACMVALGNIKTSIKDLFRNDILEPKCVFASPDPGEELAARRSLEEGPSDFLLSPPMIPDLWRRGSVLNWERCNKSLSYTKDILTVVPVHGELKELGLEVLVETGDRDMVVPFVGTMKWKKSLNLTVVNDWRPWFVDGQVAGYTVNNSEYGYRLTYAIVKGADHTAPGYYRRQGCKRTEPSRAEPSFAELELGSFTYRAHLLSSNSTR
ncbi:unnamed protein product [Camellia sinensis]